MKTVEEKAKAYDEALERAREWYNNPNSASIGKSYLYAVFPELRESEDKDEEIKKALITFIQGCDKGCYATISPSRIKEYTTWLEKQGENEANKMPIWKHWKDGICGNGEGKPIYLIKDGDAYSISSVLGYECDYIELSELDKLISVKDTEKIVGKIEPKFKVGN